MKRVQYRIKPLAFANERPTSSKAVHTPHHAYMGRKGTPDLMVQADKAPMKDSVRPVGATKVMGWPARHLRVLRVAWRRYRAVASMAFDVARLSLSTPSRRPTPSTRRCPRNCLLDGVAVDEDLHTRGKDAAQYA